MIQSYSFDLYANYLNMNIDIIKQTQLLPINEQLQLIEAIWDNLTNHSVVIEPSNQQVDELEIRLNDYLNNPEKVVGWDTVKNTAYNIIG